jgi:hypothetical protein
MNKCIITSVGFSGAATKSTMRAKQADAMFESLSKMDHIMYVQIRYPDGSIHAMSKSNDKSTPTIKCHYPKPK